MHGPAHNPQPGAPSPRRHAGQCACRQAHGLVPPVLDFCCLCVLLPLRSLTLRFGGCGSESEFRLSSGRVNAGRPRMLSFILSQQDTRLEAQPPYSKPLCSAGVLYGRCFPRCFTPFVLSFGDCGGEHSYRDAHQVPRWLRLGGHVPRFWACAARVQAKADNRSDFTRTARSPRGSGDGCSHTH